MKRNDQVGWNVAHGQASAQHQANDAVEGKQVGDKKACQYEAERNEGGAHQSYSPTLELLDEETNDRTEKEWYGLDQTCRDENQRLFRLLLKVDYELSGEDPEGQRNSVCCINLNLGFVVFLQLTSDEN